MFDVSIEIYKDNINPRLIIVLSIICLHWVVILMGLDGSYFGIESIEKYIDVDKYHLQVIFWIHVFSIIYSALVPKKYSSITNAFIAGIHAVSGLVYMFSILPVYGFVMAINGLSMVVDEGRKISNELA